MHAGPAVIGARCCFVPTYYFRLLIFWACIHVCYILVKFLCSVIYLTK